MKTELTTHDTTRIDDTRIGAVRPLITPALLEEKLPVPDAAQTLVETSREGGFTRSVVKNGNAGFDPALDRKGVPVPLAVAAEKGGVAGIAAGRGTTRIVAIGDSTMFANASLAKPSETANNHDFANLAVGWLLDRPQSLAIGPKPIREYQLHLTERQVRGLRWTLLGGLPGGVLLVGFAVWLRRRS